MSRRANEIRSEIATITCHLIEIGLCAGYNFPEVKKITGAYLVGLVSSKDFSIALKNKPREEVYKAIIADECFSMVLKDGSVIQLSYTFAGERLTSHRLVYFPKPYFSEIVEAEGEKVLSRIKNPLVRFDYAPENVVDHYHSASHLHIEDLEDCRIPVFSPLTPNLFIYFLLRNFYSSEGKNYFDKYKIETGQLFDECIAECEKKELHIGLPK